MIFYLDYSEKTCEDHTTLVIFNNSLKVMVGPKRSTNRNLKEIITIERTKTVIFQLPWP